MQNFTSVSPYEYNENMFKKIGKQWALISAQKDDTINAMTASWGGIGILWNKPVVYIFIRPQRYTNTLIDATTTFSLSFFHEEYRDMLQYMGRVTGKKEDKIKESGLHLVHHAEAPMYKESEVTIICEKLYQQQLNPNGFINTNINEQHYPSHDHHIMYVGEIKQIYQKTSS